MEKRHINPPELFKHPSYTRIITVTGPSKLIFIAGQGGGPPYQVHTLQQQLPKMVFVGTTTIFFAAVNAMKIVPYFMLGQFSARNFSTSLVLLPIAVVTNFAGIWMVKSVPTELLYRITYILLFILGGALLWQGARHLLHEAY